MEKKKKKEQLKINELFKIYIIRVLKSVLYIIFFSIANYSNNF